MIDGIWETANEVDSLGYKVHNAAMIVELVAADISDNAQSGALWAASEMLVDLSEKIELKVAELMRLNSEHKEIKPKGKKK